MQGNLSVERMCRVTAVSRASFYRWLEPCAPVEEEMEVRAAIQVVVLEHRRRYGYRRVTRELRRQGLVVNHKRVARLMREDNLLSVQPRAWVTTTDSRHELAVYMNLAMRMKITGINQLWVADITYIRLAGEFVYLAVVLDIYSRKVVGWALDRTLAASLAVAALKQAIEQRQPPPGLVHHSDRGLQYVSQEYVQVLVQHQIEPSMSRPETLTTTPSARASCAPSSGRKSMPAPTATWTICAPMSPSSSSSITIDAGCTRRWVTGHRRSSSRRLQSTRLAVAARRA